MDWEELARREPYFALLTNSGAPATEDFFETGEADIAALLEQIAVVLSREVELTDVLDFGCGAGRLTLPLARRAERVVAYDIAPAILVHGQQNAAKAGLDNVIFSPSLPDATFSFICSLLVFQYIPASTGYPLLRRLVGMLRPGGVAAIHLVLTRGRARLRRFIRFTRGETTRDYDEARVVREIESAGATVVARLRVGDGSVLVIEKR
ncbi:MAG: methylase involved in ubiquinone/menaquinone biosynthesis [Acidobacteria bacterium]|nr:methylase involved in ubiquinone/menaquinone biosynthesis [Acidobacteriota bacterium]